MSEWQPEHPVKHIVAPVLPGRQRTHNLAGHQCLLDYIDFHGRLLRRQVVLIDARNATYSVLLRAYSVAGPKSQVSEYRVHKISGITGADGQRLDALTYLRQHFGLVIK